MKINNRRLLFGLVVNGVTVLFFFSCQPKPVLLKPALTGDGEIYLYLQALPQEAESLRVTLQEISAIKEGGTEIPLFLSVSELNRAAVKRQRFIASARLPSGYYSGLAFRARNAFLKGEEGEAALLVPPEGAMVEFPFQVRKKRSSLFLLTFDYRKSMGARFRFSPVFSVNAPDRLVTSLLAYVVNYGSNTLTVFNKRNMQVAGVIATGRGPSGIAIDSLLLKAYVALSGEDAVDVIDISSGEIVDNLRLRPADNPQGPVLTPDRRILLTVNTGSDTVSIIDTPSLVEQTRIRVGDGPGAVRIDPRGRNAFVFNTLSNTISVINLPNQRLETVLSTEEGPLNGQFNRSGDRLFVIHERSPFMTVVDPISFTTLERVFVGRGISSIRMDTKQNLLYLGQKHRPFVEVYNSFSLLPVDSIQSNGGVAYMAIDDEENNLHLVVPEKKSLMAVNLISKKMVGEIDVGERPYEVGLVGER